MSRKIYLAISIAIVLSTIASLYFWKIGVQNEPTESSDHYSGIVKNGKTRSVPPYTISTIEPGEASLGDTSKIQQIKDEVELIWTTEDISDDGTIVETIEFLRYRKSSRQLRLVEYSETLTGKTVHSEVMLADSILANLTSQETAALLKNGFELKSVSNNLGVYEIPVSDYFIEGEYEYTIHKVTSIVPNATIEPNYIYWATATKPSDPEWEDEQWALAETGTAIIRAPQAWDLINSATDIKIAILDTGIDINHEDLSSNIWRNLEEIEGNGIDDDSNGYIDDINGFSFIESSGDLFDEDGHGTHVAGIAAAQGNNSIGVSGVAWNAKLVGIQILDDQGLGSTSEIIRGIEYANTVGAKILNMSIGGNSKSLAYQNAITAVQNNGGIVVASAGNEYSNLDENPSYPASYPNENILSVGSVDRLGELSSFSNFSSQQVDLAAPGSKIFSTYPTHKGSYATLSGTSMSAPMVSGSLALIDAKFPGLTIAERIELILGGLDRGRYWNNFNKGSGTLNLENAVLGIKTGPYYDFFEKPLPLDPTVSNWELDNRSTTRQANEPQHNGNLSNTTIWLQLVFPERRAVRLSTTNTNFTLDTAVYTGNSFSTLVSESVGSNSVPAEFIANAGVTYRIALSGRSNAEGIIKLEVQHNPINDDFQNSISIQTNEFNILSSFSGATIETGEPNHGGVINNKTLWWSFIPSETGEFRLDTIGSEFDTTLAVYQGSSLPSLTLVDENDNASSSEIHSSLVFNATTGAQYHIAAGSKVPTRSSIRLKGGIIRPLALLEQPQSVVLAIGQSATLRVRSNQAAFAVYQWFKDGSPIENETSDTLHLLNIQGSDTGAYKVIVSTPESSIESSEATLGISNSATSIGRNPGSFTAPIGTNGFLYGRVDSQLPVTYQWYKNGEPLAGETSETIKLENISSEDDGLYHLEALGAFGTLRTNRALVLAEDESAFAERSFWPSTQSGDNLRVVELHNQFFILGHTNALYQSSDGKSWIRIEPGFSGPTEEISFDGSRYYIFNSEQECAWSENFKDWTSISLPAAFDVHRVCYGNGVFVASATRQSDGNLERIIAVSNDAIDWIPLSGEDFPTSAVFGKGVFVGVANYGNYVSTNGTTWERISDQSNFEKVVFSGSQFLLTKFGSSGGSIPIVSTDGYNWSPTSRNYRDIYGSDNVWLTQDWRFPTYNYSTDTTFYKRIWSQFPETNEDFSIAHSNGALVMVSETSRILTTKLGDKLPESLPSRNDPGYSDLINRPIVELGLQKGLVLVNALSEVDLREKIIDPYKTLEKIEVRANGSLQSVSTNPNFDIQWRAQDFGEIDLEIRAISNGVPYTVAETTVFSSVPMPPSLNANASDYIGLAQFDGNLYRLSSNGSLQFTRDGRTWKNRSLPQYAIPLRMVANENGIVIVTRDLEILHSTDGLNWEIVVLEDDLDMSLIDLFVEESTIFLYGNIRDAFRGQYFPEDTGLIWRSEDGLNWSPDTPIANQAITDLKFDNGRLAGLFKESEFSFEPGNIATASNAIGSTWEIVSDPIAQSILSIEAADGLFLATTPANRIVISSDGFVWTELDFQFEGTIREINSLGESIVVNTSIPIHEHHNYIRTYQTTDYNNWRIVDIRSESSFDPIAAVTSPEGVTVSVWTRNFWNFPIRGTLRTSVNGGPFEEVGTDGQYTRISWFNGLFIAVGQAGSIAFSEDGLIWSTQGNPDQVGSRVSDAQWFKNSLFLVSDYRLYRYNKKEGYVDTGIETDGPFATTDELLAATSWVDNVPVLLTSSDGVTFESSPTPNTNGIAKLLSTPSHFVGYFYDRSIEYTTDGESWSTVNLGFEPYSDEALKQLTNGEIFIEKEINSSLLSNDPAQWNLVDHDFDNFHGRIAYGDGKYWLLSDLSHFTFDFNTTTNFNTWSKGSFTYEGPSFGTGLEHNVSVMTGADSGVFTYSGHIHWHDRPSSAKPFSILSKRLAIRELSYDDNTLFVLGDDGYFGMIPLGDLTIANISASKSDGDLKVGDNIAGEITIGNYGIETVSIEKDTTIELNLLTKDGGSITSAAHLETILLEERNLSAGEETVVPFETVIPDGIHAGLLYLQAIVDTTDNCFELSEYNNSFSSNNTIGNVETVTIDLETVGNGTLNSDTILQNTPRGVTVEIYPISSESSRFDRWSGDHESVLSPAIFIADRNMEIQAHFVDQVTVDTVVDGLGSIILQPEESVVDKDSTLSIEAIGNPGWRFDKWSGSLDSSNSIESLIASNNLLIQASFEFDYDIWLAHYFSELELADSSLSGMHADPDKDGTSNLVEAKLGTNPRVSFSSAPFRLQIEENYLIVRFKQIGGFNRYDWVVQSSSDMISWDLAEFSLTDFGAESGTRDMRISINLDSQNRRVFRLVLQLTE